MLFRSDPMMLLYLVPTILISLTVHEFSHGYVAYRLGDPTAKAMGRLSFNPVKHLDFLGTLLLLFTGFGWAKPVQINPMYFNDIKKGTMLVSLAGPLSNVLLAILSNIVLISTISMRNTAGLIIGTFAYIMYFININLAVFNLLPIPPMDGSKILAGILPNRQYYKILEYERYVQVVLILIVFLMPGVLTTLMKPLTGLLDTAIKTLVNPIARLFTGI